MRYNAYSYLPLEDRADLCRALLEELGVTDIRHNPITHELVHGCLVSDYHRDQQKNPTASLNYDKGLFHCLGCQASGTLAWFIAVVKGTSSEEARSWIASRTGVDDEERFSLLIRHFDQMFAGEKKRYEPIPVYSPRMLEQWEVDSHWYLEDRGISGENIKRFRLGYDPKEDGIVIPHFWKGDLVGWQIRYLSPRRNKYGSTPSFPKRRTLFNYQRSDRAVVVEAPISAVKHEGEHHFEATIGAAVTDDQLRLLERHDDVVLWMDNDHAGWRATHKIANYLMNRVNVWVVDSPFRGDPADLPGEVVNRMLSNRTLVVPYVAWRQPHPQMLACERCFSIHEGGVGC